MTHIYIHLGKAWNNNKEKKTAPVLMHFWEENLFPGIEINKLFGPCNYIPFCLCRSLCLYMWLVPLWSCHYDSDGNNLRILDERRHRTILTSAKVHLVTADSLCVASLSLITCSEVCELRNDPVRGSTWGLVQQQRQRVTSEGFLYAHMKEINILCPFIPTLFETSSNTTQELF